ncbi:S-type pyocin domain-containing protein [Streptomyces roseifaciens]
MSEEEIRQADNVVAFHRPRPAPQAAADRCEVPDGSDEPEVSPTMVLNAERGIINTGTVHGGQHVTAIEFSGHPAHGADGDI